MPGDIINHTTQGWPYLDMDNAVDRVPTYTSELADKLENGDARVSEAINAANTAIAAKNEIVDSLALITTTSDRVDALETIHDRTPARMAAGKYSGGQVAQPHTGTITFPTGRFTRPPIITATIDNNASGADGLMVTIGNVTATTAQLVFLKQAGATTTNRWCTCTWIAIQMTDGSAAG